MEKLIVVGAGGHAKSLADSINPDEYCLAGFIDEKKTGEHFGYPILGNRISDIKDYKSYVYIIGIGDNDSRFKWYKIIKELGLKLVNIIDKTAVVASSASIGEGNFIGKLAVINADSKIGDNNIINTKALIEHECVVGNHNHLSTNSVINGNVEIADRVFIGSSSVCIGQLKVGCGTIVGAGSVVTKDVGEEVTVVGVPAHVIKNHE